MHDVLMNKRKFRTLNIIDDYNRQAIAVEADHSLSSMNVIQLLERIIREHRKPLQFRIDNGPDWTSLAFRSWCQAKMIFLSNTLVDSFKRFMHPLAPFFKQLSNEQIVATLSR